MANKFNINKKKLTQAKPCLVQVIRDAGHVEYFEDAKSGQLLEIHTGKQLAYINLDPQKIINFNPLTDEDETHTLQDTETKTPIKLKTSQIIKNYIFTNPYKTTNLGTEGKPVMGFICHEKEFNALPNKPLHDSIQIRNWLTFIVKNFKDFNVQRIEAIKTLLIVIGIILIVGGFVYFKYGIPAIAESKAKLALVNQTIEQTTQTITENTTETTIQPGIQPYEGPPPT